MGGDVLSGGVTIAVAAILWLIYLVPTWSRRRKYFATERNAVRLQQALRVLAETSETPREVALETKARKTMTRTHQRAIRIAEAHMRSQTKAALVAAKKVNSRAVSTVQSSCDLPLPSSDQRVLRNRCRIRRIRRMRASSSLVLFFSLIGLGVGISTATASGDFFFMGCAGVGLVCSFAIIIVLARKKQHPVKIASAKVECLEESTSPVTFRHELLKTVENPPRNRTWTPASLPQPLHNIQGSLASEMLAHVSRVSASRTVVPRAAEAFTVPQNTAASPFKEVSTSYKEKSPATRSSPFASMGFVEETAASKTVDLDAVLRQRRAAS